MTRQSPCVIARLAVVGLLAAAPVSRAPAADPVRWRADYDTARKEAQDKGLPLVVEIGTEECFYCKKMEATTFRDPAVAALLNARFVPLRVDANKEPALAQALKVQVYPTTVLAAPDGKIHAFLQGYVTPEQFQEHANRAVLAVSTPDWVARDLDGASKAVSAGDYSRAVTLLKAIIAEAKPSPARTKATQVLAELEQSAADRMARAKGLADKGESTAAAAEMSEVLQRYAGTAAAVEAAGRLAGRADAARSGRARELLAQARDDFQAGRYALALERSEFLTDRYPELPEATDAATLAAQVKADPDRLAAACDQMAERSATMYLTLAASWAKKGQSKEAAECLEKVARIAPNTRFAEAAQAQLALLRTKTDSVQAGFEKSK